MGLMQANLMGLVLTREGITYGGWGGGRGKGEWMDLLAEAETCKHRRWTVAAAVHRLT